MYSVFKLLSLLLIPKAFMAAANNVGECAAVGSNILVLSHRFRERQGLYLNLRAPSKCDGLVTSWHYCYGVTECGNNNSTSYNYSAKFMVYRPAKNNSLSSEYYVAVPESIKSISVKCQNTGRVKCGQEMLPRSEWFAIQENDVLAVCFPEQRQQFQLISREYEEDRLLEGDQKTDLYQYNNIIMNDDCDYRESLVINRGNLTLRKLLQLHLSAEITQAEDQNSSIYQRNDNTTLYLQTIPASAVGLVVLILAFVVAVGIAFTWRKQKQTLQLRNCTSNVANANGNCRDQVYSVPMQTRGTTAYNIETNVAYNPSSQTQCLNIRDTYGYEVV